MIPIHWITLCDIGSVNWQSTKAANSVPIHVDIAGSRQCDDRSVWFSYHSKGMTVYFQVVQKETRSDQWLASRNGKTRKSPEQNAFRFMLTWLVLGNFIIKFWDWGTIRKVWLSTFRWNKRRTDWTCSWPVGTEKSVIDPSKRRVDLDSTGQQ